MLFISKTITYINRATFAVSLVVAMIVNVMMLPPKTQIVRGVSAFTSLAHAEGKRSVGYSLARRHQGSTIVNLPPSLLGRIRDVERQTGYFGCTHRHSLGQRFLSSVPVMTDRWIQEPHLGESDACPDPIENINGSKFQITSPYPPMGDQPQAIDTLVNQVQRGDKFSCLRGCTGTGKTFVMAHTIARLGKPTLVLCHNKTLAAQLARELRSSLRHNHVELFVSYYNHYVPESYNESTDRYNAKKSSVNDELDALRHLATRSLVQHEDVVVVASVSCIYGLGMPKAYLDASIQWSVGDPVGDEGAVVSAIENLLYAIPEESTGMSSDDLSRGKYQWSSSAASGRASLMVWPPSESFPMRIDFERDVEQQNAIHAYKVSGIARGHASGMESIPTTTIFPAKHHLTASEEEFEESLARIQEELLKRVQELRAESKNVEADRLSHRVGQDLLLLRETRTCAGVENYSRHMALREAGEAPDTLLDYFGYATDNGSRPTKRSDDWLLIVDESHVTLPQLKAMYGGDRARKEKLVKHGYRLPSALDNRPLRADEFWKRVNQAIFVSATPSKQELGLIAGIPNNDPVDMLIRPTFVCDPDIVVRPMEGQLSDLLHEILERAKRKERTLAMTITKRDAEDLADYLMEHGVSASFIHSGLNTHERSNALKALQNGEIDCLVGVNLLREGLDLPQVSLVAILNADSEGFLRSETALLQTIGRAARNMNGTAILYANRVTESMQKCIDATKFRREVQLEYNSKYGKEMKSTQGSSVLSIFDLLKDQIQAEKPLEVVKSDRFISGPPDYHVPDSVASLVLRTEDLVKSVDQNSEIITDHLPSKPGVYFWKDDDNNILYIGKAKKLRSRVKSYMGPGAKHSPRIRAMLRNSATVEFILTPSDRDALILENKLIKHHQPPYNVLLKDDESYPYICATIGDSLPQFTSMPRRQDGVKAAKYKYFGPYPHHAEINTVLQGIEEKYDLRSMSFQARFGTFDKANYQKLFNQALHEVFESSPPTGTDGSNLSALRSNYEEASELFESEYNISRDVIAVGRSDDRTTIIVYVLQLRDAMVVGRFSYECELASGLNTEEDFADAMQHAMEKMHYPSGASPTNSNLSFFPQEILVQYPLPDVAQLKYAIRSTRQVAEPDTKQNKNVAVRIPAKRGKRKESDQRALLCAIANAEQVANEKAMVKLDNVPLSSVDGTAIKDLTAMLSLKKEPKRIECYDISHTQGNNAVGSRVVFINGKAAPHLYRTFNIKGVSGPDDYASIEEVLERRFRRVWGMGIDDNDHDSHLVDGTDQWAMPDLVVIDGGKGQLSAALKGMSKANVFPEGPSKDSQFISSAGADDDNAGFDILEISEEFYPPSKASASKQCANVPIVALAKRNEDVFISNNSDPVNKYADSSGLLLLRALRDESHRFALKAHRRRRRQTNGF